MPTPGDVRGESGEDAEVYNGEEWVSIDELYAEATPAEDIGVPDPPSPDFSTSVAFDPSRGAGAFEGTIDAVKFATHSMSTSEMRRMMIDADARKLDTSIDARSVVTAEGAAHLDELVEEVADLDEAALLRRMAERCRSDAEEGRIYTVQRSEPDSVAPILFDEFGPDPMTYTELTADPAMTATILDRIESEIEQTEKQGFTAETLILGTPQYHRLTAYVGEEYGAEVDDVLPLEIHVVPGPMIHVVRPNQRMLDEYLSEK